MTKKRFKHYMGLICEKRDGEYYSFTVKEVCDLLNEQNETIAKLKSELLSKEDLIQQLKNILGEDFYKKWKETNLNYIRVCEELAEENRIYEKLSEENEQFHNIANDYNISFDKLCETFEQCLDENEQLKAQLYCDDEEGVCNICKYHYLVQNDEVELGYYNSRCRKGHYECARVSLKYCEDFEKELEE